MDQETWAALLTCAVAAQESESDRLAQAGVDAEDWLMKQENRWED